MYFQEENNYGLVDVQSGTASLLPDYTALSSQMASIAPTGVAMGSYSPSNTAAACPSVASATWAAKSSPLPPVPNPDLCACMYNSLQCTIKSSVEPNMYGSIFGTVCGLGGGAACAGIRADPLSGTYGAYSMCNSTEMLSFVLDQYYKSQQNRADACNFQGAATLKQAVTPASTCAALMSQAGSAGTGTVLANPISGASGTASSSKKPSAGSITSPDMQILGVFLTAALASILGAGMILL